MDNESEGEDGEDLQGVFDAVPSENSDLIPPCIDEVFDELPFSPIEETPPVTRQQPSPPATVTSSKDTANISTTVEVSADVHVSVGTNFDLDATPTGWHVSYSLLDFHLPLNNELINLFWLPFKLINFCLTQNILLYLFRFLENTLINQDKSWSYWPVPVKNHQVENHHYVLRTTQNLLLQVMNQVACCF